MENILLINENEETIDLECNGFFIDGTHTIKSPIDKFYEVCSEYVKLTKPEIITLYPDLSRLLLMGFVSAVEEYLRNTFSRLINICPFAREKASEKMIKFGSIDYYDVTKLAEGLFDSSSFASEKEIKSKTRELLGVDVAGNSSLNAALSEFNKICHLRHCAVHSGGVLNGHNAKELGLDRIYVNKILKPNEIKIQEALKVCYSFVRAFNQYLFEKFVSRWVGEIILGNWDKEKESFVSLVDIFWSKKDMHGSINYKKIYRTIMPSASPKDIFPEDESHHSVIKQIMNSFKQMRPVEEYTGQFNSLTLDEYKAVIEKIEYYDEEEAQRIHLLITSSNVNDLIKLHSIKYLYSSKNEIETIESLVKPILENNHDDETLIFAVELMIEECQYKFENVFPILFNFTNLEYVENIMNKYEPLFEKINDFIQNAPEVLSEIDKAYKADIEMHLEIDEFALNLNENEIRITISFQVDWDDGKSIMFEAELLIDSSYLISLLSIIHS